MSLKSRLDSRLRGNDVGGFLIHRQARFLALFCILGPLFGFVSSAQAFSHVEMIGASVVYYPQVETQYALQLSDLKNRQSGFVSKDQAWGLYQKISEATYGTPTPLKSWNQQVGSAPLKLYVSMTVKNYGNEVSALLPVTYTLTAKTGTYLVRPDTLLLDLHALRKSARWEPVVSRREVIPVLAPKEKLAMTSGALDLGAYLRPLNQRFPVTLQVDIAFGNQRKTILVPVMPPPVTLDSLPRK